MPQQSASTASVLPNWRNWTLVDGILTEPSSTDQAFAFWLPGAREAEFQYWQRVNVVPQTDFTVEPGIHAVAATVVPARQQNVGLIGKFMSPFRKGSAAQAWLLPNGNKVHQCGARRSDLILVWTQNTSGSMDESWIKSRWPGRQQCWSIGTNLYLVAGVQPPVPVTPEAHQASECQAVWANQLLEAARQSGDRHREATALTDLGAVLLHNGKAQEAMPYLQAALTILHRSGDQHKLADALDNMGRANLALGQTANAKDLFGQALFVARGCNYSFGEKSALQHLGQAHGHLGDVRQALLCLQESLSLAIQLGHRKHQAELHWLIAIQHAETGHVDAAINQARAAVELFQQMLDPEAAWYGEMLSRYQHGKSADELLQGDNHAESAMVKAFWGGAVGASEEAYKYSASGQATVVKPNLLRMALSATKAMGKFIGSGVKIASSSTVQRRLRTCAACSHHTGLRCRLCGCFTAMKARLPHEECPAGKWNS